MDSVLSALAQNIPAAVALIIAIVYFLRAIKDIIAQFQQILSQLTDTYKAIFEGQREALNLVATHIKQLSEFMIAHDGWERENIETIKDAQQQVITDKLKSASSRKGRS